MVGVRVEFRAVGRADPALPEAHRRQTVPVRGVRAVLRPVRPSGAAQKTPSAKKRVGASVAAAPARTAGRQDGTAAAKRAAAPSAPPAADDVERRRRLAKSSGRVLVRRRADVVVVVGRRRGPAAVGLQQATHHDGARVMVVRAESFFIFSPSSPRRRDSVAGLGHESVTHLRKPKISGRLNTRGVPNPRKF